jgi:hypothetical protein
MGAVPVVLDTNPFSVGLDEHGGAVAVGTLEEMPGAVMKLLDDPERLSELRECGMKSARAQVDWGDYVDRVDAALSQPPPADPGHQARGAIGERLLEEEDRILAGARVHADSLNAELQGTLAERSTLRHELATLREELTALGDRHATALAALEFERERMRAIQRTRAWRLMTRYWRTRDGLRGAGRRLRPGAERDQEA